MKILGIPRHILYAKTTSGEIPGFKIGKLYKYERSKLLEWQQAQRLDVDVDGLVERYMQQHILKG
jgi:methionine synthase II (cobalamin-independent)